MSRYRLGVWVVTIAICSWTHAGNWPQWRGPYFNGSADETNLPDKLSPTETMLWSTQLPGHGSGTPIVWDDRVFVSSVDKKTDKLVAICIGRIDGKILWQREAGMNFPKHGLNDMASPSAITDGKSVYFYYGSGDLAAFDIDGKAIWARNLQKDHGSFNNMFLYGSSPLLYRGKLYVQVIHRDTPYTGRRTGGKPADSYLLAIDPATGKDLWKHIRITGAQGEAKESYGTPLPHEHAGRNEVVIVGADYVTSHHAETGSELWRCDGWNPTHINHLRMVPAVTAAGDLLVIITPKVMGYVMAIRAGGSGNVTATHIAWQNKEVASDVCNPLYYQNHLYVLDGDFKKGLSCLDAKTGQRKWFTPISSGPVLRSSPTGADGKIHVMNEAGDVWVFSAADGAVRSKTSLGSEGRARGSISAAAGCLFVRTGEKLHAFGRPR